MDPVQLKSNEAYGLGYAGEPSPYADATIGVGPKLHQMWLKGKNDKSAGKPSSPPFELAKLVPVEPQGSLESKTVPLGPIGARRRKTKGKTKGKGKKNGKKSRKVKRFTRRR